MVKDLRISKGGYGVSQGGVIGSITDITSMDGDFDEVSVKATVSNYTLNVYASAPISQKVNVSAAYRQTFYNLYNNKKVDLGDSQVINKTIGDMYINPDYSFRDANVKLSGKAMNSDSYYISLYGADNRFKFSIKQPDEFDINASEKNRQFGGSASYKRVWNGGSTTKVIAAFSIAMHTIAGIAYSNNEILLSLEGYYKKTENSQYIINNVPYRINNTIFGAGIFAKKQIRSHTLYGSYSINSIQSPQKELSHELKIGGIGSFNSFFVSFNYVFGTGFDYISTRGHGHGTNKRNSSHGSGHRKLNTYNRFDVSATYKAEVRGIRLQAGVSLLNLFNNKNH